VSDCYPVAASRLLYTSQKRCGASVNPKRPAWKCKNAPTWILMYEEERTDQGVPAIALCEDHKREWTSGCEDAA
jgi:hypothetical protein